MFASTGAFGSECPSPTELIKRLEALPIEQAARTEIFGLTPPTELYQKALKKPDDAIVQRDGKLGQVTMVATVPVADLWKVLNDDEHHDDGDTLPLRSSVIIEGEAGQSGRETFQYFNKAGLGRWWINQMNMNQALFDAAEGRLWELRWHDVHEEYPGDEPPVEIDAKVRSLEESIGAWLLVPLSDQCTLIEYTARGEPGGMMGAFQFVAANRTLRKTVEGMVEMARGHLEGPHPGLLFVRPDGSPMD